MRRQGFTVVGSPRIPVGPLDAGRTRLYRRDEEEIQQKRKGWGTTHPPAIRNGEWEYGLFTPDGKPIPINTEQACMGCHKLVEKTDHTYIVHSYFADRAR
jgi:hypothetical protein